jgi:hypothetical protein
LNVALTAVQVGLLTIYDMCKAADCGMVMTDVRVLEKHGGNSGDWTAAVLDWGINSAAPRFADTLGECWLEPLPLNSQEIFLQPRIQMLRERLLVGEGLPQPNKRCAK